MDRRKAMKIFAGVVAGSGVGAYTLGNIFKAETQPMEHPVKLEYNPSDSPWAYSSLDPAVTGDMAYSLYPEGSCMYAVFKSVLVQLADKYGEPFASFPYHMMKYGRSGIGSYGTVCGALNGAAALIGLLVEGKSAQDTLIAGLFRWYENNAFPVLTPLTAELDFTPPTSVAESTLCHASVTSWVKESGYKPDGDERVERCRRLTGDVAMRTVEILNQYTGNTYVTAGHDSQNVRECMTCHGNTGKLNNTNGKMQCSSCHTESVTHKIFAEPHYRVRKEQ
ncbi:MAG: C-GCAxxG-C-C family protein [Bacteroidales bacterium]